jgi:hypothetical protein
MKALVYDAFQSPRRCAPSTSPRPAPCSPPWATPTDRAWWWSTPFDEATLDEATRKAFRAGERSAARLQDSPVAAALSVKETQNTMEKTE